MTPSRTLATIETAHGRLTLCPAAFYPTIVRSGLLYACQFGSSGKLSLAGEML